jgi:hypothetical protein
VPAASPLTFWLPLAAVLLTPMPLTLTADALDVLQEIVEEPGALALFGVALIEPETCAPPAETVTVAIWVTGPPAPCAVSV